MTRIPIIVEEVTTYSFHNKVTGEVRTGLSYREVTDLCINAVQEDNLVAAPTDILRDLNRALRKDELKNNTKAHDVPIQLNLLK